jgi:hypothetical protein
MIDITKTYQTRCGYPVRIYATDGVGAYPIHGAYCEGEDWILSKWTDAGNTKIGSTCPLDIIEVKPRIQRDIWVNVYNDFTSLNYETKQEADANASLGRLACVKLTIDCEY